MPGAPSAMTDGILRMLMLFVVSLDSQTKVRNYSIANCSKLHDNEIYRSCSKAFSILWCRYW